MADTLHADIDRMNELVFGFDRAATGVEAVTTTNTAPQVAAALAESATGSACHAGAHTARTTLNLLAGHYRTIRAATATCADTYERADAEHARRLQALIPPC